MSLRKKRLASHERETRFAPYPIKRIPRSNWRCSRATFSRLVQRIFGTAPGPRSDVSPQPLCNLPQVRTIQYGPAAVETVDPEILGLVSQILAKWSYVEVALTRLTASFLGAHATAVAAMLSGIQNARLRIGVIERAAKEELEGEALDFFGRTLAVVDRVAKVRNRFAHDLWATSPELPGWLLLIDPKHVVGLEAKHVEYREKITDLSAGRNRAAVEHLVPRTEFDDKKVFGYTRDEINQELMEARRAEMLLLMLEVFVHPGPPEMSGHGVTVEVARTLLNDFLPPRR